MPHGATDVLLVMSARGKYWIGAAGLGSIQVAGGGLLGRIGEELFELLFLSPEERIFSGVRVMLELFTESIHLGLPVFLSFPVGRHVRLLLSPLLPPQLLSPQELPVQCPGLSAVVVAAGAFAFGAGGGLLGLITPGLWRHGHRR